jgi:hypothetical protein
MNRTTLFVLALVCTVALVSCEREINLDLKNTFPKLVVEGNVLLGSDTLIEQQEIKLSLSANYTGNNMPEPVTNATVRVKEGVNTYEYVHVGNGLYRSEFTAISGKQYQLTIEYNGDLYEAAETMRSGPVIDSLTVVFQEGAFGDDGGDFVALNTVDPADQVNYYMWRLLINNVFLMNATPGNRYRSIQKDEFFNGQPLIDYVPSDEFPVLPGDLVEMQQYSISEQMYNYYYAIFNLTAPSSITGDIPPGRVLGNVVNKTDSEKSALGYFGACSISIKTKQL